MEPDRRFNFVADLSVLELVMLSSLLTECNFKHHVASDIGVDEQYVSASNLETQSILNNISQWTDQNLMKMKSDKTKYMVFSRSEMEFERIEETKLVGVWLTTWLDWDKNTIETCKKA